MLPEQGDTDGYRCRLSQARDAYCAALLLKKLKNDASDSLIVMTYINVGATYYNLNHFDSASYYLLKAESLINRFPGIEYKVRLYNTLGVLYHDNGNYLQCKNYFSEALEIIKSTNHLIRSRPLALKLILPLLTQGWASTMRRFRFIKRC
jgi:tetratricopeptide (TPR) repeat protein